VTRGRLGHWAQSSPPPKGLPALLSFSELRTDRVLGSCSRGSHTTIVLRWIEAFNERDLEAEKDVLAPGYVAHVPAATSPLDLEVLDAWRQFTTPFVEAFPDLRLTVEDNRG
jgi:SnoaL-like domain